MRRFAVLPLLLVAISGCMHVKGKVVDPFDRPLTTAKFSLGRPDGLGAYSNYSVNGRGEFDFQIPTLDENKLYVYDGSANPALTMRRIERGDLSDKMRIVLRPASPDMLPGMNINP